MAVMAVIDPRPLDESQCVVCQLHRLSRSNGGGFPGRHYALVSKCCFTEFQGGVSQNSGIKYKRKEKFYAGHASLEKWDLNTGTSVQQKLREQTNGDISISIW